MKKLLRVLSVLVLYLPNLAFVGFVLLSMMAQASHSYSTDPGMAEFSRNLNMVGLAVLGATVIGMISKRAVIRLPLACATFVLSVLFFFGVVGEPGADGKAALVGLGAVLVIGLGTIACMAVSKLLAWAASKMPEKR